MSLVTFLLPGEKVRLRGNLSLMVQAPSNGRFLFSATFPLTLTLSLMEREL